MLDFVKNPIIIKNNNNYEIISEKLLQRLILEDIPSFLEELGDDFTFIKNEYKIRIGNIFNYIDLLLFNIKYNCYVVVELKVIELKKEHIEALEEKKYDYPVGVLYSDMFMECEKAGDFIINVTEAILEIYKD